MNKRQKSLLRSTLEAIEIDLKMGVLGTLTAEQVETNVNARLAYLKAEAAA